MPSFKLIFQHACSGLGDDTRARPPSFCRQHVEVKPAAMYSLSRLRLEVWLRQLQ